MFDVSVVSSTCELNPGRTDRALRLQDADSANTPVSIAARLTNFNRFPYCLAFTVTIEDNDPRYLMNVVDPLTGGGSMVSLIVSNTGVDFTVGSRTVTFDPPTGSPTFTGGTDEVVHLQICVNSTGLSTFYVNCEETGTSTEAFEAVDTSNSVIFFLNNATREGISSSVFTVYN